MSAITGGKSSETSFINSIIFPFARGVLSVKTRSTIRGRLTG